MEGSGKVFKVIIISREIHRQELLSSKGDVLGGVGVARGRGDRTAGGGGLE